MTYEEAQLSLLLLSEIGYGGPMRTAARLAKQREDAAAAGLAAAVEKRTR